MACGFLDVLAGDCEGPAHRSAVIAAAKAGDADDAMRLWARRVNYRLTDTWGLDEMAKPAGMKARLVAFYTDLAKRCPGNAAVARALKKLR